MLVVLPKSLNFASSAKCNGIVLSYADSASDRASKIASLESYLKGILDSQPNCKFKVERKASGGSEDVHRKVTYIFTKAAFFSKITV